MHKAYTLSKQAKEKSNALHSIVTHDSGSKYCSISLTTLNNVGSKTLYNPFVAEARNSLLCTYLAKNEQLVQGC